MFRSSPLWLAATLLLSVSTFGPVRAEPAGIQAPSSLPRELGKPEDEFKIEVKSYLIDGLPEASAQALAAITAPYTGPNRGHEDLVNAAAAVTRYIQSELGYYVGFAYVPEQKPVDGVIHLQAVEGRLDQVQIQEPQGGPPVPSMVAAQLATLQPGRILREAELDRVVLLLNDLRGWRFKVEVGEGRTMGTASLKVTPMSEPGWSARVEADTLGNRDTGLVRVSGAAAWDNPLRHGDALSAQLMASHTGGLRQGSAAYTTPLGSQGLKAGMTLSRVDYDLAKSAYPAGFDGSVTMAGGFGLYPLVRSRNFNVFSVLSFEHKRFEDHQAGVELNKFSDDWRLGLIADSRDSFAGGGINAYEVEALRGGMHFGPSTNPLGLKNNFNRVTLSYSRLQTLLPERLQLFGRYKGQLSGTSLDPTERYAAGGPLGVRAYAPGEAAADTAHVVNAELRWLPPEAALGPLAREVVVTAFYDWAHVKFFHDAALQTSGVANTGTLSGGGLGVIWDRPGVASVRLDLAWRGAGAALGDPRDHAPRANAVLSKRF